MLTASPSPRLSPSQSDFTSSHREYLSPNSHRRRPKSLSQPANSGASSPIVKPHSTHVYSELRSPNTNTFQNQTSATQISPSNQSSLQCSPTDLRFLHPSLSRTTSSRSISTQTEPDHPSLHCVERLVGAQRPQMVDAQTQYSPSDTEQKSDVSHSSSSEISATPHIDSAAPPSAPVYAHTPTAASAISRLQIEEKNSTPPGLQPARESSITAPVSTLIHGSEDASTASTEHTQTQPSNSFVNAEMPTAPAGTTTSIANTASLNKKDGQGQKAEREPARSMSGTSTSFKRNYSVADVRPETLLKKGSEDDAASPSASGASSKKRRPDAVPVKTMPEDYSLAAPKDLTFLISSMLMELLSHNDSLPLTSLNPAHLTRFHSRAPPAISVHDYLARLTTHATLSPPILLSMVYYIDRLCTLYPAFTISSLTVHRFLITAATVASKGLSDSFWTNKTYARVGGVSVGELALLEMEFLTRVQWRIVPRPEVLVDYYRSLVTRAAGYRLADEAHGEDGEDGENTANSMARAKVDASADEGR